MKNILRTTLALLTIGVPAMAQQAQAPAASPTSAASSSAVSADDQAAAAAAAAAESSWKKGRPVTMQYFRAQDQRGLNVFETTKVPGAEFGGFKFDVGAAFTSQVQNLHHSNTATPNVPNPMSAS